MEKKMAIAISSWFSLAPEAMLYPRMMKMTEVRSSVTINTRST